MKDPLIDEVRELRRQFVASVGGDIDRLGEELRRIEREYRSRTGRFAGVPRKAKGELFPKMNKPIANPIVDEVRAIRAARAKEIGKGLRKVAARAGRNGTHTKS